MSALCPKSGHLTQEFEVGTIANRQRRAEPCILIPPTSKIATSRCEIGNFVAGSWGNQLNASST